MKKFSNIFEFPQEEKQIKIKDEKQFGAYVHLFTILSPIHMS